MRHDVTFGGWGEMVRLRSALLGFWGRGLGMTPRRPPAAESVALAKLVVRC